MVYNRVLNIVLCARPCCWSIPHIRLHLLTPTSHPTSSLNLFPLGNRKSVLHVWEFVSVLQISSLVYRDTIVAMNRRVKGVALGHRLAELDGQEPPQAWLMWRCYIPRNARRWVPLSLTVSLWVRGIVLIDWAWILCSSCVRHPGWKGLLARKWGKVFRMGWRVDSYHSSLPVKGMCQRLSLQMRSEST